jgi:hypothetical protein
MTRRSCHRHRTATRCRSDHRRRPGKRCTSRPWFSRTRGRGYRSLIPPPGRGATNRASLELRLAMVHEPRAASFSGVEHGPRVGREIWGRHRVRPPCTTFAPPPFLSRPAPDRAYRRAAGSSGRPSVTLGGRATSGWLQGPDQLSMHPFSLAHHRGRSQDRSRYPGSAIRPSTIVPRPDSLETSSVPPIASRRSTMPCIPVP